MKKLRRILSIMLCLFIAVGLAACGGGSATPATQAPAQTDTSTQQATSGETQSAENPDHFVLGMPWINNSADPATNSIGDNIRTVVEACGGEVMIVDMDSTPDGLINNISELISRGADAILFMPLAETMLPTVDAMCSEAGVYWGSMLRRITDESIYEQMMKSEYYAGGCYEDDELCGENLLLKMGELGVTNVACINITKGDTSSDLRDSGAAKGAAEAGINIVGTSYGILDPTDMTKTIESYLAAYPELDGIVVLGTYCMGALSIIEKALEDNGKAGEIKVGRIDFEQTMEEYFANGTFHVCYGAQCPIDPIMATVILVNKVIGTPIEEGPVIIITPYLPLSTAEEAESFTKYFVGDTPIYTKEEVRENLIRFYNPSVDKAYLEEMVAKYSVEDVVARHGK